MRDLAIKVLAQLGFHTPEGPASTLLSDIESTLLAVLEYHQSAFAAAGKASNAQTVVSFLAAGEISRGVRERVNLWEDVVLARMVARHDDHAIHLFRARFEASVAGW